MTPLFTLGPLTVTPYSLTVLAGALAGVLITLWKNKSAGPVLPFVLAGALLLGHMWWVLFCPPAYTAESGVLSRMLRIWEGGYTLYGALVGGTLGAIIGCRACKLSVPEILDTLAPGACAALVFCRLGEYFTLQGFGSPVDDEALHFLPVSFCVADYGYYQEWCFAVWAWEAIAALIILIALLVRSGKAPRGHQTILFVTALGTSQILLEQMRRDDFVRLNPFVRLSQIVALFSLVAVLAALFILRRPEKKKILASVLELVLASLAVVAAEFVFDKPQYRVLLYLAFGLSALGLPVLLVLYRGRRSLPAACPLLIAAAALLAVHIADRWEADTWLLYGMMAVSLAEIGIIVWLNAARPLPEKA